MAEDFHSFQVPLEFEAEVKILVEELQSAADDVAGFNREEIQLIKSENRRLDVGSIVLPTLVVSANVAAWIAKGYFDKNVLPIILDRIEKQKQSKQFLKWLREALRDKK